MREIDIFTYSFSIADYFKEINRAFNENNENYYNIPKERIDVLDYHELGDPQIFEKYIAQDFMETRISFLTKWVTNKEFKKIFKFITSELNSKYGDNFSTKITGYNPLLQVMEENLHETMITSFFLAFIIIFTIMIFVCKNFYLALISMIPNVLPVALILAFMGWLNIPINTATILIPCIILGIAVDDTIHFLIWFRRNMAMGFDIKSSIVKTFMDVGKAIVTTSIVLFAGFIVMISATVTGTQEIGLYTALAMLFALLADLFLLPALLIILKPGLNNGDNVKSKIAKTQDIAV